MRGYTTMKKYLVFLCTLVLAFSLCGCLGDEVDFLKIRVLKIGKADAIVLQSASGAVLIDAGEAEDSAEILEKAAAWGIRKFDYMILTHFDKDHVGGAAGVIEGIPVDTIIEPGYLWDSKEYHAYDKAADLAVNEDGTKRMTPENGYQFELDGVKYTIRTPHKDSYEDKNDYSLVIRVEYQGHSALLTGDALDERTAELLSEGDLTAEVLKVPHHGSYEKGSKEFFAAVSPRYSVITCSEKNPADEETIACLKQLGSQVYVTADGDVEITFTKNGIKISQ